MIELGHLTRLVNVYLANFHLNAMRTYAIYWSWVGPEDYSFVFTYTEMFRFRACLAGKVS